MKKTLFLLTIALAFAFLGCQKEGVYNPSKKLKRIYVMYNTKKALSQEWIWNKNQLNKIEYFYLNTGNLYYSSTFSYDGDKISKIQDSDGYYTTFKYKGNQYDKVEYYNAKSELRIALYFTYTKNKITSIEGQFYSTGKSTIDNYNAGFLTTIIPELRLSEEDIQQFRGGGGVSIRQWNFEYIGNNVSRLEIKEDAKITTHNYEKYDKNLNPFFQTIEVINTSLNLILSKNNVLEQTTRTQDGNTAIHEFTYVYDGQAPTEVQRRTNSAGNVTIYNTYYEYVK